MEPWWRLCFQHLVFIERKRIITAPNVVLRLNRGERPDPMPAKLQAIVADTFAREIPRLQQYPSYSLFYSRLVRFLARTENIKLTEQQVVVGAGIEEFIRTLMFLCCGPGQKALVLWPTCAMYDIYAEAFLVDMIRVKPQPNCPLKPYELVGQLREGTKVLFLPNPGQPVETCYDQDDLRYLAAQCLIRDVLLVVDEAHFGFGAPTALPLVEDYSNLIVMRTFSKFFGAASIRVGYCVGQEHLIKALHGVRPSGEITGPSLAVAMRLLDVDCFENQLMRWAAKTAKTRDWLRGELQKLGFEVGGTVGFSLLVNMNTPEYAAQVSADLAGRGIYVKSGFAHPVDSHLLLACGDKTQMELFLENFKAVL